MHHCLCPSSSAFQPDLYFYKCCSYHFSLIKIPGTSHSSQHISQNNLKSILPSPIQCLIPDYFPDPSHPLNTYSELILIPAANRSGLQSLLFLVLIFRKQFILCKLKSYLYYRNNNGTTSEVNGKIK